MNHTLTHTHTTLGMCLFSEEDDLSYLSNDVTWIDSRGERLKSHEKGALTALVQRLRRMESGMITSRFAKKILEDYFNKDEIKELIQEERRTELRNLFQAAIVRELILREEDETSMIQRRGQFLSLYPFLINQEGTSLELTWLNRFERAMRFLLRVLPAQGHKISFINIAAHLQGSDIFTEYVTGGANRPETQRRVDLFEAITAVKPLVRAPRVLKKKLAGAGINGVNSDGEKKRGRGRPRKTEGEKKANYTKKSNQSHRKNSFSSESSFDSSSEQQVTFMTTLDACSTDDNSDSEESSLDEIDAVKFFNESFGYEINSFLPPAPSSSNYVTSPLPVSLPASESFLLPASSYYPYDANLVYSYQSDSNDDDTSLDQLTQMLESEEEELSMNDREEEILMYGQEDLMVN